MSAARRWEEVEVECAHCGQGFTQDGNGATACTKATTQERYHSGNWVSAYQAVTGESHAGRVRVYGCVCVREHECACGCGGFTVVAQQ